MRRPRPVPVSLISDTLAEAPGANEESGCDEADMDLSHPRQGFDDDLGGERRADADAHIANLADHVGLLTEQLDLLLFAETHFAEAMRHFRRSGKLLDADCRSCAHLAE